MADSQIPFQVHVDAALADPNLLSVFGLILYTEEHPHVLKVLADSDYWRQFDAISGDRFAVFSARPDPGRLEFRGSQPGSTGMMVGIWKEPENNRALLTTFGLKDTSALPCFVVFARLSDGELASCEIKLSDESAEKAHARLKEVLAMVAGAASLVLSEYRKEAGRVFKILDNRIKMDAEMSMVRKAMSWITLIKSVRGFLGHS